jgi:hypothetical protein
VSRLPIEHIRDTRAEACLQHWDCQADAMDEAAPFQMIGDPMEKLLAGMEFYIHLFEDPHLLKSCLAGTTVQESAETNPKLCDAANVCIANQEKRFKARLDEACKSRLLRLDTDSLAKLWIATIQEDPSRSL